MVFCRLFLFSFLLSCSWDLFCFLLFFLLNIFRNIIDSNHIHMSGTKKRRDYTRSIPLPERLKIKALYRKEDPDWVDYDKDKKIELRRISNKFNNSCYRHKVKDNPEGAFGVVEEMKAFILKKCPLYSERLIK